MKENIDQLQHKYLADAQTAPKKDSQSVTGLWIITCLYLITGLVVLVVYVIRIFRRSRRAYDTYNVRYKDGFVVNDVDE